MLIEMNLEEILSLKITVPQATLIYLISKKTNISPFEELLEINKSSILYLKEKGILTEDSEYKKEFEKKGLNGLKLTKEFESRETVDLFDEFYDAYPISVVRPDGIKDYLRGDISRCRKIYNKIIEQSMEKHNSLVDCLKFEISTRTQANNLKFMKRMSKWLAAEEWLLYDEFMKDKTVMKKAVHIYGADVE